MIEFSFSVLLELGGVIGLALLIGYFLSWAVIKVGRRSGVSRAQLLTIRKWIRVLMLVLMVVGIVNVVGLGSELELLTLGGLGVLLATLALQRFISNWLAGFVVFSEDTLRLGDVVEISGEGKGRVVKVWLRDVWIMSDSGALSSIENSRLEQGRLWNYSAAERLRKSFESKDSIN